MRWEIRFVLLAVVLGLVLPGSAMGFGPLSSFGTFGSGAGELDFPRAVAVGPDGTAFLADVGNLRVSVFASDGSFVRAMGEGVRPGGGDVCTAATGCQAGLADGSAQAIDPGGVALGPEGRLFVSDAAHNRVVIYGPDGTFYYFFGTSHLDGPLGLEFDRSGLLHVANSTDNRIDVFTAGGGFVRGIGKDVGPGDADVCMPADVCQAGPPADGSAGAMSMPQDVAFGPAGELIVSDYGNRRIDVFAATGSFLRAFGKEVDTGGGDVCTTACQAGAGAADPGAFASPIGVVADAAGGIYVADRFNSRVGISRIDGSFSGSFDASPDPLGVTFDCRGALHVSEGSAGFARVERFGEAGTGPTSCIAPTFEASVEPNAKPPSNRFRFAGLVKNRRNGSAVLFVRVPGPGRLILKGRGVRRLARSAPRAMRVRLPVKPKVRLRHFLKKHGKGRIRVEVTFKPVGGIPRTLEKPILLKRRRG